MEYINYVVENWEQVAVTVLAIIGAASAIAKLTPTPKDDAVLGKIKKIVEAIALNK